MLPQGGKVSGSWLSRVTGIHVNSKSTFKSVAKQITLKGIVKTAEGLPIIGSAIARGEAVYHKLEGTVASAKHAISVGAAIVREQSRATGTDDIDVLADTTKVVDEALTQYHNFKVTPNTVLLIGAGFVVALFLLRKGK